MDSRQRLLRTLAFAHDATPPRYEAEFSDETIQAWKSQGFPRDASPEEYFGLDRREDLPIQWRRKRGGKSVLHTEADLRRFRRTYDSSTRGRFPRNWKKDLKEFPHRDYALSISPWNEGFLQVLGVGDWSSLVDGLLALHDSPRLVEAAMDHYAVYLGELLDRILPHVKVDYAVYYAPIASNHAPVVSPGTYAHFVAPALRRVIASLERHNVSYHFVWTSGQVRSLIPVWLDAGINGLVIRQVTETDLTYHQLRRDFEKDLRFFGGINWRAVVAGKNAVDQELDRTVRPLLEQGGYVPHLDDTVRPEIPFEDYSYYRRKLNAMVSEICP